MNDRNCAYEFVKQQLHYYLEYYKIKEGLVPKKASAGSQAELICKLTKAYHDMREAKAKSERENSILKKGILI